MDEEDFWMLAYLVNVHAGSNHDLALANADDALKSFQTMNEKEPANAGS